MSQLNRRELIGVGLIGMSAVSCSAGENDATVASPVAKITPLLTFAGKAESAVNFYVALFKKSELISIDRYGPEGPGQEGSVRIAEFTLCGQRLLCIDSPVKQGWTFTPAISLYVEDADETVVESYFAALSKQGKVFMPLAKYPFSQKFGWVQDKFGVSWQLSAS
jgi:predicted 3-demethylubiquinone-9 3-methyltransferase (glyoxalase superfamily)